MKRAILFRDTAELDWDDAPNANEPPRSLTKATQIFNKWVTRCTVEELNPREQGVALIEMIAETLEDWENCP